MPDSELKSVVAITCGVNILFMSVLIANTLIVDGSATFSKCLHSADS